MAQITLKDIIFSNVPNKKLGTKMGNRLTQTNATSNAQTYIESQDFYKLINAVDIDWNGIQIDENIIINDTADLINWIASAAGQAGADGVTPHIGANGNWFIGETDTEVKAQGPAGETGAAGADGADGADGKSAYELAVENGFEGNQSEWLASLKGADGQDGAQGPKGDTGTFDASALEDYATKTFVGEKIGNLGNATEATEAQGVEGEEGYVPAQPAVAHTVKSYVDKKITDLVGAAPQELDTLKEISDKLGDNDDVVGALTTQIASKANADDVYTKTQVDNKIGSLGNASEATEAQGVEGEEGYVPAQPAVAHTVKSYVDVKDATHYTKTAADEKFATIANLEEVERVTATALNDLNDNKANAADVYTKTEIDDKDAAYYTKTEVDNKIGALGNATEATEAQGEEDEPGYVPAQPAVAHTVKSYVDKKISDLINGADSAYDTLKEISDKLVDNDDVVSALTTQIASKANAADVYTKAEVDAKDATHYTKAEVDNKIGTLGNKSEAQDAVYSAVDNGTTLTEGKTYYTSNAGAGEFTAAGNEVADGTNYFVLTTAAVEAVPYENVMEVIIDNEEVTAAAFTDLQAKYEALLARVAALENPGD